MRLKNLEVVGFKSFFEPTSISFAPGLSAVVGPNGCGKSNVVVALTRRYYRSGYSEYLINKISCRLKDMTEFFMASQIHSRSFAIIEQGRIDEIIQAKPQEIRAMLEEEAGLSLFKGRRDISERKLERVKENLARVDDVLSEIERQLNYARRQAKKAESYRIIRAELSELERLSAARRILDQKNTHAAESDHESELRARAESARIALSELAATAERATSAAQSAEAECATAR